MVDRTWLIWKASFEINQLREELKRKNSFSELTTGNTPCHDDTPFTTCLIETIDLKNFPKWKTSFNTQHSASHLFYFGGNFSYCAVEVVINDKGFSKTEADPA